MYLLVFFSNGDYIWLFRGRALLQIYVIIYIVHVLVIFSDKQHGSASKLLIQAFAPVCSQCLSAIAIKKWKGLLLQFGLQIDLELLPLAQT